MSCCTTCPMIDPVVEPLQTTRIITFETIEKFHPQTQTATATISDMLCAVAFTGCGLPDGLRSFDAATGGALAQKVRQSGFAGQMGEQLIVDLRALRPQILAPRFVMLVGLGENVPVPDSRQSTREATIIRETLCAVIGAFTEAVRELDITELSVDLTGLWAHNVDLIAMAALLRCRLTIELRRHNLPLERLQVICNQKEAPFVRAGLAQVHQLCVRCTHPCFIAEAELR